MKAKIWVIMGLVAIIAVRARAGDVDFYSDAVIENGDVYNIVRVYDTAPEHTVVDMYGGSVGSLRTYDLSTANIYGGELLIDPQSYNSSTINIYGGSVVCESMIVWHSSTLNIYGGDLIVGNSPYFSDSSAVNIYGYGFIYDGLELKGILSDGSPFLIHECFPSDYERVNLIEVNEPLDADVEIKPKTLNLTSKGKWLTCKIWPTEGWNVREIDPESVLLERRVEADWAWFNEEQNVAMFRFSKAEVATILEPGDVELTVSGHLVDWTYFDGTDIIKVIDRGATKD